MTDYVNAWQCIGCGKIEAPQPCIGVCTDRKVEFVYAAEHEEVLNRLVRAERKADAMRGLVRQLCLTTPRDGGWERSYVALQQQGRRLLEELAAQEAETDTPSA